MSLNNLAILVDLSVGEKTDSTLWPITPWLLSIESSSESNCREGESYPFRQYHLWRYCKVQERVYLPYAGDKSSPFGRVSHRRRDGTRGAAAVCAQGGSFQSTICHKILKISYVSVYDVLGRG
jgi:hypothetical protein